MQLDLLRPDLEMSLRLGPYAPREARHRVAQVDRPSPDLRDAVTLLSSELVTLAVERSTSESIELRVWMPSDVVRVEVEGSPETVGPIPIDHGTFASLLLEQIADRWEIQSAGARSRIWFEIDRQPVGVPA
jgi:hypothetical protein